MRLARPVQSPALAMLAFLNLAIPHSVAARSAPGSSTASPEVSPQTPGLRRMFLTSETGTGDLSTWAASGNQDGLLGANQICQTLAEDAGLATDGAPEFRAWISDPATDAWCNIQGLSGEKSAATPCDGGAQIAAGPWIRTDGALFANDLVQLAGSLSAYAFVPVDVDESGAQVATAIQIFSATDNQGAGLTTHCESWTTAAAQYASGNARTTSFWSFAGALASCSTPQRMACFEVGVGIPVAKPNAPGHIAFVTSAHGTGNLASWPDGAPAIGIEAGDAICQAGAAAARLPQPASYVAWLSDDTHDAACRIRGLAGTLANACLGGTPQSDGPYRRVDGFVLAGSLGDLLDGLTRTSLSIDEFGANQVNLVPWTGTLQDGTLASINGSCSSWTSAEATAQVGLTQSNSAAWTSNGGTICSTERPLYCFSTVITLFWDGFDLSASTERWSAVAP